MPKREVICSQQIHCLSCPLSIQITGKDCKHLSQYAINKLNKYITNILENDKKSIEISISTDIIKYCYKADNIYDFERRLYFLSLIIEKKIFEVMTSETKKA